MSMHIPVLVLQHVTRAGMYVLVYDALYHIFIMWIGLAMSYLETFAMIKPYDTHFLPPT